MHGRALGPYRLDRELGAGGMGKVWAARVEGRVPGLDVGAVVALKVVHPHLLETPGFFKRFLREAEIGKAVVHENVVRTFDCDSLSIDGKRADFLVMEYVEGQTLRGLLAELERVPEELCRHIGREVAKGLAAIHAAGLVHRDVKPDNVLITRDHVVKLMDLGIARGLDNDQRMTQTGVFVGSIPYAAPEQFAAGGRELDARADLHALGATLYELATGVQPFLAEDAPQTIARVLNETPRRAGELNPQLSAFFEEALRTLLEKDRAKRFDSAAAVAAVLDEGESCAWWRERMAVIRAATHRPIRRIRIPRETALYGRDAEIAKLRGLFAGAKAGEGRVLLVQGEAGIGKSRLLDEFAGLLAAEGEDVNFLWGGYPPGGAATAAGAFSTAYGEHFGGEGSRAYLGECPALIPAFDALLRCESPPTGELSLTKDSIQTCFVRSTQALAKERPTIVLIDDLHFAPDEGRALFASLAFGVVGHRVLLVGTARPGVDESWLAQLGRLEHVAREHLARLSPRDLVQLLADSLKSPHLAEELAGRIGGKSDGNPYFVFEILRGLREGQFLTQRPDGTWSTTRLIREIQIPPTVRELIEARMSDLAPEDRQLLEAAACVGYEFDPLLVGEALGIGRFPLLRRLGAVEKSHRLVRSAGRRYVFDHHQVQEELYGGLSDLHRESYHAALGATLEARSAAAEKDPQSLDGALALDLAEHFLRGADGVRAARYVDAAMTHLERRHLNGVAAQFAARALGAPGVVSGAPRAKLLVRRALRLEVLGRFEEERAAIEEAVSLAETCDDAGLRRYARRQRGWNLSRSYQRDAAEAVFRESLDECRAAGDLAGEEAATRGLAGAAFGRCRFAESKTLYEQARELAKRAGNLSYEARSVGGLANVEWVFGHAGAALALYEQWMEMTAAGGDRRNHAFATSNLASALLDRGRLDEARSLFERVLATARDIGDRRMEADCMGYFGNIEWDRGRYGQAMRYHDRQLELCRELDDRTGQIYALINLNEIHRDLGEPEAARPLLDEADRIAQISANPRAACALKRQRGLLAFATGDLAAAEALLAEAVALSRSMNDRRGMTKGLVHLGDVLAARGRAEEARAALVEAAEGVMAIAADGVTAACRLATIPGGDPAAARAVFDEKLPHLALAARMECRFLLWMAAGDLRDLVAAKQDLDHLVAHAPPECREAMRTNVRVNREIVAACKEQGIA